MVLRTRSSRRMFLLALGFTCLATPLLAQPKPPATGRNVVDVVTLKSGRSLRGLIAWRDPNGSLAMIVSKEWLASGNPGTAAEVVTANQDQRQAAWIQTRDRIVERLKTPVESQQLAFLLKQEKSRLDKLIDGPRQDELEYLWIDVAHETISKTAPITADQRKIALFAWSEGLTHVETRDAASLAKELSGKGVKLDVPPPDLSERLPPRIQSNTEWSARLALAEYSLGKPVDFQGMGDTVTRTGEGQAINLGEVLPKILQTQLGSLLKDLTGEGKPNANAQSGGEWLKTAIREAESAKSKGFRVTRLDIDANSMKVTVDTRFVAKVASEQWQTVWQSSSIEDGTKARPAAEARIEQDPQLKSAVQTLKNLGLADAGTLQKAIRVGAATMSAQQSADAQFGEFRDGYMRRLDGPPWHIVNGQ